MPKPKAHPMRRTSDPGGDSFTSFRDTLKWLIPTCVALISGMLWLQRMIAEQTVNSHEATEQKELIAKIDGVRNDLSAKMTTQWAQFYTKGELDSRREELYRRIEDERKNREDADRTMTERIKDLETQLRQKR